jgi:hypothetical protein
MYARVIELNPSYLDEALFNLAMMQEKQGKRAECILNLEKAVIFNPDNGPAADYLAKMKADGVKGP